MCGGRQEEEFCKHMAKKNWITHESVNWKDAYADLMTFFPETKNKTTNHDLRTSDKWNEEEL